MNGQPEENSEYTRLNDSRNTKAPELFSGASEEVWAATLRGTCQGNRREARRRGNRPPTLIRYSI
jgi:hypothetical protein